MLISYLDESGNTGKRLDDPVQPHHYVAAVLVREDRIRDMTAQLNSLARVAPTAAPLSEYRGSEIFSGLGAWFGVPPRRRVAEYKRALTVLREVDAVVAHVSIDKPRLAARHPARRPNPHLIALQFLLEEVQRWVARRADPLSRRILQVADETDEHEQDVVDLMDRMLADRGPVCEPADTAITLDRFVDNIHFVRSERSRGIQLADLVAFILRRCAWIECNPSEPNSDAAVRMLKEECIDPRTQILRDRWP